MSSDYKDIEIKPVSSDRIFTKAEPLAPPAATYTVSARNKAPNVPVFAFLRENYGNVPLREIDSLFGFVEKSTLYGGRGFLRRELSDRDVQQLNSAGIGIRLPMSNHYVELDEYKLNKWLLDKYHRPGNSVICTNDDLARWIRADYPDYRLDASVIKNIKTMRKIDEAMELYDTVVLPMPVNEDLEFLELRDRLMVGLSGFHGLLPRVNLVQRLATKHLRPQYRGRVWGRRLPGARSWNPPIDGLDERSH